jgi:hypothetical protein
MQRSWLSLIQDYLSTGPELDGALARSNGIEFRLPLQPDELPN